MNYSSYWLLLFCMVMSMYNDVKCQETVQIPCPSGQFQCEQSKECIADRLVCDSIIDCQDNSDEYICLDKSQGEFWNVYFKKRPDSDRENLTNDCVLSSIPTGCVCKAETRSLCIDQKLTGISVNGSSNLTHLDISGNDIERISPDEFRHFRHLRYLTVQYSGLKFIEAKTFVNNTKIMILILTDNKLSELKEDIFSTDNIIQELRLTQNNFGIIRPSFFRRLTSLKTLFLDGNMIENIAQNSFKENRQLEELILNNNNLEKIDRYYFKDLKKLRTLSLLGNRIKYIASSSFLSLESLSHLNLAENLLETISTNTFVGLHNLTYLDLRQNIIRNIEDSAFLPLVNLLSLELSKNRFREVNRQVFDGLINLKHVYFDAFYMCGYVRHYEQCSPWGDGISSQENLLENRILRVMIWVVAVLACFGNSAVILGRFLIREDNQIHSFFIKNLSLADLIMGIYLLIIASQDLNYRGVYLVYDIEWRNSWACDVSGILTTLSSEVSVLTLTLITFDRYMCITYPLSLRRRNIRLACTIIIVIWTISVVLSILPTLGLPYFGSYFYRNNAVCVPLLLHEPWSNGWEYSVFMFVGLNLVSFAFISYAYCSMFFSIRQSRMVLRSTHVDHERSLMKRFSLIVITDFICWMPIICLKLAALGGLDIQGNLYSWIVIFILPVNSALNPLLYTLTTKVFKQTFWNRLYNTMCRRNVVPADSYSTYSISKFRYSRRNTCTQDSELDSMQSNGKSNSNAWCGKIKYKYREGQITYIKGNGPIVHGYSPVNQH